MPQRKGRQQNGVARAAGAAATMLALTAPTLHDRGRLPRAATLVALAAGPPGIATVLPLGRIRAFSTYLMQMWAYLRAFELTYDEPERLRRRLRVEYPIAADRWLGAGVPPGVRLQAARRPWLDRGLATTYFLWAPQREVALLWVLIRHPGAFPRSAALVSATFDAGWVIYSIVPTAPPWWAAKHGFLNGLHRVTVDVSKDFPIVPEQTEDDNDQANPWASMPSTHVASATAVAIALAEVDPRAGALAAVYVAMLALALVYLGEHYVADVLAGAGLAAAVRVAQPAATPLARALATRLS